MRTLVLLALMFGAASTGCETVRAATCDPRAPNPDVVAYDGGEAMSCVYMSSTPPDAGATPWEGELLFFPGAMHYKLAHHLGCTPQWVQTYLSFDRYGTRDNGSLAQSAGNQVVILGMDETTIVLANDSCVDYWLLVSAGVDPGSCSACGH
jgi:hypothetical protein